MEISKYIFFILLIFLISNDLISSKLYQNNPNDIYYQEYLERISFKKHHRLSDYDYDNNEYIEKPTSSFDFLFKSFKVFS